ncbi:PREDICTED: low-temperature-induced 65 kDa protein-like [Camelina sativa]|uniref:Low-temperature-induced 65 kDa protein-like n=1 Tax=Camelina sativa TaxID=90675 RepID=A0ABM0ZFF7_CAMSA|nr:PREDICTED: low-temperature-induced 65 kDa protein-like [Camelina sativa]
MSRQLDPVAELESLKTHVDHSGNPSLSTLSQRSQSGEASKRSPSGSPRKENEGEHSHHKKSLFSKMKDKAKKLQHSLSTKKRHDEDGDATMSPFSRSEDHEVREGGYASLSPRDKSKDRKIREDGGGEVEEEEDPEYLGAPMYESKKAPEELKKTAMQHPRENPVITETNVLSVLPAKHDAEQEQKDCTGSNTEHPVISEKNVLSDVKQEKPVHSDTTTLTGGSMAEKTEKECTSQEPISPSKTVTETVTEKLAPAYAKVSDATNAITKKIQDMAFPESTEPDEDINDVSEINTAGTNQPTGFNTKVWDKGVSMKEYISQKFEPSEDDRELSRVISKAISPRKASSQATSFGAATTSLPAPNSADNKAPLLANTNEIVEEENHGKILQPN